LKVSNIFLRPNLFHKEFIFQILIKEFKYLQNPNQMSKSIEVGRVQNSYFEQSSFKGLNDILKPLIFTSLLLGMSMFKSLQIKVLKFLYYQE
jgi:hypothetical protein